MLRLCLLMLINTEILLGESFEIVSGEKLSVAIMGSITQKNPEENVVLVKMLDSGKVQALRAGHKLKDGYKVAAIEGNFMDIVPEKSSAGTKAMRVYKEGFAPKESVPSAQPQAAPSAIAARGANLPPRFSEEGFVRVLENGKGNIELTQDYRKKMLTSELPKILMQASTEAIVRDGTVIGFQLDQIEANSIFEKAGIQNGDIITSIGGQALTDASYTIKLLNSLKNADSIEFEIERGGSKIPINISVK